ncbi:hypothetical protein LCGC14_2649330 [marine sediment metagenome]|uniref:Uncharacterized protein n=1 Tax=marine sediment metagenome TaxID=412755 RepID=A0A0F9C5M5_9ZZZZ
MPANGPRGPRIVLKPGVRGAWLYASHLDPDSGVWRILRVLAMEAPELRDGVLFVTELWRAGGGLHPRSQAVDVRTGVLQPQLTGAVVGSSEKLRYARAWEWIGRSRIRAGDEFDLVFGRDVDHVLADAQHLPFRDDAFATPGQPSYSAQYRTRSSVFRRCAAWSATMAGCTC